MDDALNILDYLPGSIPNTAGEEYIAFLWQAFTVNYENENYQFAILAYHMLYMSFAYCAVWKIRYGRPDDFSKALLGYEKETEVQKAVSPFDYWVCKEKSVFNFLRLIAGCEKGHIGNYTQIVNERNDMAHSNGKIDIQGQDKADEKISTILRYVEQIHKHLKPVSLDCMHNFLLGS